MFIRGHECKVVGDFEPRDESVGIMSDSFMIEYVMSIERHHEYPHMPVLHLLWDELTPGEIRQIARETLEHDEPVGVHIEGGGWRDFDFDDL